MTTNILTAFAFKIFGFGFSIPEPLLMLVIGVILILLPFFAVRLKTQVVETAESFGENIHETLSSRTIEKTN